MRSIYAEISLDNLKNNFLSIRHRVGRGKFCAVVKADSYGNGMIQSVNALESLGAEAPDYYAVAILEEALELRSSGLTDKNILVLAPFSIEDYDIYVTNHISATICTDSQISDLEGHFGTLLGVHVKIDTGMGRLGFRAEDALPPIKRLFENKNVALLGLYTHFATSDEKDLSFAYGQKSRLDCLLSELKNEGINPGIVHAANSGAIISMPDAYYNMVRPGIILYGYYPSNDVEKNLSIAPVLSLKGKVSTIKKIKKGDSVSYGRKFIAENDCLLATLPIGYADGLRRGLSNKMQVLIGGKRYNQIGTITMDRIMILVDGTVTVGDEAVLIGRQGTEQISLEDWAGILDTISYELSCDFSKRLRRVYL